MASMEKWRKFFEGTKGDIFTVIEAAIKVATSDCPHQLRKRRDLIMQKLFTSSSSTSVASEMSLCQEESHLSANEEDEDHSGKAKEEYHKKIDASKRTLQQGYQQAEKVQVIQVRDLPKQHGSPIFRISSGRPIFRISSGRSIFQIK
ncbi:hypothetical protein SUGI_0463020 [Cryptomeria japonica]|nr:hypothetical protein SUGI_0463020 [Cryptomeria japonica]